MITFGIEKRKRGKVVSVEVYADGRAIGVLALEVAVTGEDLGLWIYAPRNGSASFRIGPPEGIERFDEARFWATTNLKAPVPVPPVPGAPTPAQVARNRYFDATADRLRGRIERSLGGLAEESRMVRDSMEGARKPMRRSLVQLALEAEAAIEALTVLIEAREVAAATEEP